MQLRGNHHHPAPPIGSHLDRALAWWNVFRGTRAVALPRGRCAGTRIAVPRALANTARLCALALLIASEMRIIADPTRRGQIGPRTNPTVRNGPLFLARDTLFLFQL